MSNSGYMFAFIPGGIMYELGRFEKGSEAYKVLSSGNWLVTMLVATFTFTAGVEIILMGVRLFIGELVPVFKGISDKLIKNSKAAVDCPVVFPYAPNAVLIGFISSFFGGLIGMAITIGMNAGGIVAIVVLPGLVPHFFIGATAGVFGNVRGGILGAIIGPFISGIIITFIPIIFIAGGWVPAGNNALKTLAESQKGAAAVNTLNWGDTDYILGVIPGLFGKISKYAILPISILAYIGLMVDGIIARIKGYGPYSKKTKTQQEV